LIIISWILFIYGLLAIVAALSRWRVVPYLMAVTRGHWLFGIIISYLISFHAWQVITGD